MEPPADTTSMTEKEAAPDGALAPMAVQMAREGTRQGTMATPSVNRTAVLNCTSLSTNRYAVTNAMPFCVSSAVGNPTPDTCTAHCASNLQRMVYDALEDTCGTNTLTMSMELMFSMFVTVRANT